MKLKLTREPVTRLSGATRVPEPLGRLTWCYVPFFVALLLIPAQSLCSEMSRYQYEVAFKKCQDRTAAQLLASPSFQGSTTVADDRAAESCRRKLGRVPEYSAYEKKFLSDLKGAISKGVDPRVILYACIIKAEEFKPRFLSFERKEAERDQQLKVMMSLDTSKFCDFSDEKRSQKCNLDFAKALGEFLRAYNEAN